MKTLQRTLAVLACLCLAVQTVRHAYVLWLQPRRSVLDRFDRPLKDEIAAASSLDELVRRYEPVRAEADRVKGERRASRPQGEELQPSDLEPFKSEGALREAIQSWEQRARELHAVRFYLAVGLALAGLGLVACRRGARWLGTTLLIVGFSEIIYWTTPDLIGGGVREFDRLVATKLALSAVSIVLMAASVRLLGIFKEQA